MDPAASSTACSMRARASCCSAPRALEARRGARRRERSSGTAARSASSVEAGLPLSYLRRAATPRERASPCSASSASGTPSATTGARLPAARRPRDRDRRRSRPHRQSTGRVGAIAGTMKGAFRGGDFGAACCAPSMRSTRCSCAISRAAGDGRRQRAARRAAPALSPGGASCRAPRSSSATGATTSAGYARAVYDELARHFGAERVFIDVDDIRAGQAFTDVIERAVGESEVLLVLIGKRWLGERADGPPRIGDPGDFVALEVAAGLAKGMSVIPLLLDGATMPSAAQLPRGAARALGPQRARARQHTLRGRHRAARGRAARRRSATSSAVGGLARGARAAADIVARALDRRRRGRGRRSRGAGVEAVVARRRGERSASRGSRASGETTACRRRRRRGRPMRPTTGRTRSGRRALLRARRRGRRSARQRIVPGRPARHPRGLGVTAGHAALRRCARSEMERERRRRGYASGERPRRHGADPLRDPQT